MQCSAHPRPLAAHHRSQILRLSRREIIIYFENKIELEALVEIVLLQRFLEEFSKIPHSFFFTCFTFINSRPHFMSLQDLYDLTNFNLELIQETKFWKILKKTIIALFKRAAYSNSKFS